MSLERLVTLAALTVNFDLGGPGDVGIAARYC